MLRSLVLALALSACSPQSSGNPLFDGADPAVLAIGDTLWAYPTGRSDRLRAWSDGGTGDWRIRGTLIRQADIRWIEDDGVPEHHLWAPDMVAANGRYFLYYSVGPQIPTPSRIGVAICAAPQGPCRDSGKPLLTGGDGFEAIDPMVFRDPASGRHLLYAGGSAGATLRVFELAPNLLTIARELPIDQPPMFTEAPFVHRRGDTYYLSYSHGRYNGSNYSVHYATGPSPTGPWTYRGAILTGTDQLKGPGHHSFVRDPRTGRELIVYHRWEGRSGDGPYRGSRSIAIDMVHYRPDGTIAPIVMTGR